MTLSFFRHIASVRWNKIREKKNVLESCLLQAQSRRAGFVFLDLIWIWQDEHCLGKPHQQHSPGPTQGALRVKPAVNPWPYRDTRMLSNHCEQRHSASVLRKHCSNGNTNHQSWLENGPNWRAGMKRDKSREILKPGSQVSFGTASVLILALCGRVLTDTIVTWEKETSIEKNASMKWGYK